MRPERRSPRDPRDSRDQRDDPHATAPVPGRSLRSSYPGCLFLGTVTIDGTSADLYVCEGLAIARFGDAPGEVEAQHLHTLDATSNVFLLTAFRLFLDRLQRAPLPDDPPSDAEALALRATPLRG